MTERESFTLKFIPTKQLSLTENLLCDKSIIEESEEPKTKILTPRERFDRLIVKPRFPLFEGEREQVITRATGRLNRDPWNISDLRKRCDEIHGEGTIILDHILKINSPNDRIISTEKFLVECFDCEFIWLTDIDTLNKKDKGCPWCKLRCVGIKVYDLYTVMFIGEKLHDGLYQYVGFNNEDDITCQSSILYYWCQNETHEIVKDTVSKHLSQAARLQSKGCIDCYDKYRKDPNFRKPYTMQIFIELSIYNHKKDQIFDYSQITSEMKITAESYLPLICKKIIKSGATCNHYFWQRVMDHINSRAGCPKCLRSDKYTRTSFIEKMHERYINNEFTYELIKKEDIKNKKSKPKVKCSVCDYVILNTTISDFLHSPYKRQCDNCYNHMKWDRERLIENFEEREKEGIYSYPRIEYNYIVSRTIIFIDCLKCKDKGYARYQFNQSIDQHFCLSYGCPRCSGKLLWNYEKFEEELPQYFLDNFDYSLIKPDMIVCAASIIPLICKKCNRFFEREVFDHVKELRGCRFCRKSSGEKIIYMYLKNLDFDFDDQTSIMGPKGYYYFYDFEVYYKGENIIIEMDGKNHMDFTPYFHKTQENFEKCRKRDIYKHYMALKNGKRIIRIDYTLKTKISDQLDVVLDSSEKEYFSTPSMYQWLIEGVQKMFEDEK